MNNLKKIAAALKCGMADVILTSSETRQGLAEVLAKIERVTELYAQSDCAEGNTQEE